jgi:arylamine N-acetyltransferase
LDKLYVRPEITGEVDPTYVFIQNFVEASYKSIPLEDFDVLLDDTRLRCRKVHDHLEKPRHVCFRNGGGM